MTTSPGERELKMTHLIFSTSKIFPDVPQSFAHLGDTAPLLDDFARKPIWSLSNPFPCNYAYRISLLMYFFFESNIPRSRHSISGSSRAPRHEHQCVATCSRFVKEPRVGWSC